MEIQDGDAKFEVKDIRVKAIVDLMYPVGTVIAVANNNTPAFTKYGTWEKVGSGRVLWGADSSHSAGSTIEAGLPNIKGTFTHSPWSINSPTGAFSTNSTTSDNIHTPGGEYGTKWPIYEFDASKSNSIYGKSTTVQPPAYVVHFYQRIS